MSTKKSARARILAAAASGIILACGAKASAQTFTWTGFNADGNWSDPVNWADLQVPSSGDDTVVVFPPSEHQGPYQDIANPFELNGLVVDAAFGFEGDSLQFVTSSTSVAPTIVWNSTNTATVSNNLVLSNTTTVNGSGTGELELNGAISGASGLTVNTSGEVYLSASNSYSGTTTVSAGTLDIANSNALAASTLSPNGGTVLFDGGVTSNTFNVGGLSGSGNLALQNNAATPAAITLVVGGSGFTTYTGTLSGPGALTLNGTGSLVLLNSNTYSGGTTLDSGSVGTGSLPSFGTGSITVAGNASLFVIPGSSQILSNDISINNGQTLTVLGIASNFLTLNGTIVGPGSLSTQGSIALTLTNAVSDIGGISVNGGGVIFFSGDSVQLGFSSITVAASGGVAYENGAQVVGGFLMGGGSQSVGTGGASFTGTTLDNGLAFAVAGPTTFTNVSNDATVTVSNGQTLTWAGGNNANTLNVGAGAAANLSDFLSTGTINITGTGAISNSGANLILNGGSQTIIGSAATPGGTLSTAAGTTIQLNGGLLDNNGTVSGTLDVNFGSLAEGAGSFGPVTVNNGGTFHPGNSPGIANTASSTWGGGGNYQFDIDNANGSAGTNFSQWDITGNLSITSGNTQNSVFTIELDSLTATDSAGLLPNFNPADDYSWKILTSTGGIDGFNTADLAINTNNFQNSFGGTFSLSSDGDNIFLNYTAVPEPAALSMLGTVYLGLLSRRKRLIRS